MPLPLARFIVFSFALTMLSIGLPATAQQATAPVQPKPVAVKQAKKQSAKAPKYHWRYADVREPQ